jgi:hypothetical protein
MIAWSILAVGGAYVWAGVPLIVGGCALGAARPRVAASSETRILDSALLIALAAIILQIAPVPRAVRAWITPHADSVRSSLFLSGDGISPIQPISLTPWTTAYALALVATAMIVFWTARQACGGGNTRFLVRVVAVVGLVAALAAIGQRSVSPELIYGRWLPRDAGARPFGPFVNRNHFAAWVIMAVPLVTGYLAAAVHAYRLPPYLAGQVAAMLRSLRSAALWAAVAGAVMTLALVTSTSRSGLVALGVSLVFGAWMGRERFTRRGWFIGLLAVAGMALFLGAYANLTPLLWRLEETLLVGTGGRPLIWKETLHVARDFWLTGTGLGSYQSAMSVYQRTDRAVFFNQAHNQYLHLVAEGGLLLAVPATLVVAAFARLFMVRLAQDTSPSAWIRIGGASAVVAVCVQGLWETALRMPANGILFALAAAIAVHRPLNKRGLTPFLRKS